MLKLLLTALIFAVFCLAAEPTAAALAREARKAQNSGQLVRAYMLFSEAAARDPRNESYRMNRDALKPLANLLSKAGVEEAPKKEELLAGIDSNEPPLEPLSYGERKRIQLLQPPPTLEPAGGMQSFHTRGTDRGVFELVARAFGIHVVFDPLFDPQPNVVFDLEDADFRTAFEALTTTTNTFLFPLSAKTIFVARDTAQKRDEYEPQIAVTVPIPDATDPKEVQDIANGVRQTLQLKHLHLDAAQNTIVVRDRISRAATARILLENLIQPKPQVALEVEILVLKKQRDLHYGIAVPTSFPIFDIAGIPGLHPILDIPQGFANFLSVGAGFASFGGGFTTFALGLTQSDIFATSSKSWTQSLYDATVIASDGGTATMHIGDKYPIAQALYTGTAALASPLYAAPPQVQIVDLGLVLKLTPHVHIGGDISLDVEAGYSALGTQTFNSVPSVLDSEFNGSVRLQPSQWAIIAGLDMGTNVTTKTGFAGLINIPGVSQVLGENTHNRQSGQTMIVIKPHLTRQQELFDLRPFYVGGGSGLRVLL